MGASSSSVADWLRRAPPSNCAAPSTPDRSRSSATRTTCRTTGRRCRRRCCAPRPTTSRSSPPSSTTRTTSPCCWVRARRALDTAAQTVTLANGDVIAYDELVIATGLVPKRIPSLPDLEGIRVLRTFDESLALREHAGSAKRAVVIGAGFIGCEVAASLRKLGRRRDDRRAAAHAAGLGARRADRRPGRPAAPRRGRRRALRRRGHRRHGHRPRREGGAVGRHRAGRRHRGGRHRLAARRPTGSTAAASRSTTAWSATPRAARRRPTYGPSATSRRGGTSRDTKCAWSIGATSPSRPG